MHSKHFIFIIFFLQPVNAKEILNNHYKDNFKGIKIISKAINLSVKHQMTISTVLNQQENILRGKNHLR